MIFLEEEVVEQSNTVWKAKFTLLHPNGHMETVPRTGVKEARKNLPEGAILFDSKEEAEFYLEVLLPGLKSGGITHIELQQTFVLLPGFKTKLGLRHQAVTYKPDFVVTYVDGSKLAYDVKGHSDIKFPIKRKFYDSLNPDCPLIAIKKVAKKRGRWQPVEEYKSNRRAEKREALKSGLPAKPQARKTAKPNHYPPRGR